MKRFLIDVLTYHIPKGIFYGFYNTCQVLDRVVKWVRRNW